MGGDEGGMRVSIGCLLVLAAACGGRRTVEPARGDVDGGGGGGPDAGECPPGWIRCGGECTDVAADPSNCGACGQRCGGGSCASGVCGGDGGCPEGMVDCGEECRDLSGDPEYCASCVSEGCGRTEYCRDGLCYCRPELTRCADACVDTRFHPDHCGSCDTECVATCTKGVCDCGGRACAVDQVCIEADCWDYEPAVGCDSCDGCDCPEDETCCALRVYGPSCVDTRVGCPEGT